MHQERRPSPSTVSDGAKTITETVYFDIINVNDAPKLTGNPAFLFNGIEDEEYTIRESDLLDGYTDADEPYGDSLSVTNLSASSGILTNNQDGTYTLSLDLHFNGTVTLSYTVSDDNGLSVFATNSFTLNSVNDANTTWNTATLPDGRQDVTVFISTVQLLAGIGDVDGDQLSIVNIAANDGTDGTITFDADHDHYTFTPNPNFYGSVTLSYGVSDGQVTTNFTKNFTIYQTEPVRTTNTGISKWDDPTNALYNENIY